MTTKRINTVNRNDRMSPPHDVLEVYSEIEPSRNVKRKSESHTTTIEERFEPSDSLPSQFTHQTYTMVIHTFENQTLRTELFRVAARRRHYDNNRTLKAN